MKLILTKCQACGNVAHRKVSAVPVEHLKCANCMRVGTLKRHYTERRKRYVMSRGEEW